MEYKKINELTTVVTGGTPSTRKNEYWDNGDIPWLQSGCCQNCDVDSTEKYITKEGYNNSSTHMMSADTVMIALTGATAGKVGYLKFEACGNQSITGILPCESLNQRYLFFYLLSQREKILADCVGGAQAHISQSYVKNMTIPILAIKEQEQIVGELTKVSNIVSLRQEEIQQLDNLVKARFVEMFGNPVTNEKGWKQRQLGEIATKIGSGATPKGGKEAYQEEGITLIRSMNVHNGLFEYKELAHISEEQAEKLDNVTIEENDVLLNITGASVARSCVVPSKILPARVNQHVCIIRCNQCIVPEFLNKLLIDDNYQRLLWSIAEAGATREAITKQQVESLQIIMPPIELQEQFADFVHQVDKSKFDTMTFAPIYAIINLYLHTYFYQGRR